MENNRKQTVIIDLRQTSTVATPSFIQYDTNILEFVIKDNGLDAELNNIERITANYKRPDGVETSRILVPAGNVVAYEFGTEEMAEPGYGEINVQFFQGETRLSSKRLKVYFASNLGAVFENSAGLPLLQELFVEVSENNELLNETNNIIQGNETVRITAENDRITAEQERQTNTLEAISNAENATIEANDAAVAANTAKENADVATNEANAASDNANAAADNANQARINAETRIAELEGVDAVLFNARQDEFDVQISSIIESADKDDLIYGVYWDKGSDPNLIRTNNAIGMVANVGIDGQLAQNDFDNAAIYREIGEVTDELGNVFIRIPKFYIKKKDGIGFKTWQISKTKYPGFYLPWCFWDFVNNKELDYIDIGKYKASLSEDNKLQSVPDVHPLVSKNIVQFRDYARANGAGYQQLDIHVYDVIQTLFTIEFATLNSQSVMQGFSSGQYSGSHTATVDEVSVNRIIVSSSVASNYRVGQSIGIGTANSNNNISGNERVITNIDDTYDAENTAIEFDGEPIDIVIGNVIANRGWKNGFSRDIAASSGIIVANDGKYPCSYRGIESPWGDVWQFVDGVNINDYQAWVCKDAAQYTSNVFADPYEQLGYINHNGNGHTSEMGYDPNHPYAHFPTSVGGGASTYYSDYYWQASGQRIALVGGGWNDGANDGVWSWFLNASSSFASVVIGGRLLKKAS